MKRVIGTLCIGKDVAEIEHVGEHDYHIRLRHRRHHHPHEDRATRVEFPRITTRTLDTGELVPMALASNLISNVPFACKDAAGVTIPTPSNATVSIDNAAAGVVALGSDGSSYDFTPAQPPQADGTAFNVTVTVTNADGSTASGVDAQTMSTPADNVASIVFNDAGVTTRPLA